MKVAWFLLLVLSLADQRCFGQETNRPATTNAPSLQTDLESLSTPTQLPAASAERFVLKRPPLSAGKRILQAPGRFLKAINPFAPPEPKGLENPGDLNPRAWTTTIGWHSGGPSFSNPVTHESSLGIINTGKK